MNGTTIQWPLLIAGLIVGLFGWMLYWAGIPIMGGLIGACTGGAIGIVISDALQTQFDPLLFVGIGVVIGAILGVLLMRAVQIYFFFGTGATLGGALVWRLFQSGHMPGLAGMPNWAMPAGIVAGALVGGFLVMFFRRFLVALATSGLGVVLVTYGLPEYKLLGGLVSMVVFVSVQIGLVSRYVEREDFEHRMRRYRRTAPERDERE